MALLTAQGKGKALQYQADAKNNVAEAPTTANIAGATGSIGPLDSGSITRIPAPGKGFPTGKNATHSTGTYGKLTDGTIQQCTKSVAGTTGVSDGLKVSPDAKGNLQDWLASTAGQKVDPTKPASQGISNGLSSAPELE